MRPSQSPASQPVSCSQARAELAWVGGPGGVNNNDDACRSRLPLTLFPYAGGPAKPQPGFPLSKHSSGRPAIIVASHRSLHRSTCQPA